MYVDNKRNRESMTDAIFQSAVFFALCTKNYLKDVEDGDPRVTNEIAMGKSTGKKLAIIWVVNGPQQLSEAERSKMRKHLEGFNKVAEVEFDTQKPDSLDMSAIRKALE